jgi:ribosome modulation factor
MADCNVQEIDRNRAEGDYGEVAYAKGKSIEDCPYAIGCSKRTYWLTGWYDARTRHNLRHVFEKYWMTFP